MLSLRQWKYEHKYKMASTEQGGSDAARQESVAVNVLRCTKTAQKLESAAFNAVSLGQWESAQAYFNTMVRGEEGASRENAKELLKLLIMEASSFW